MSGSDGSALVIGAGVQGLTTGVVLAEAGWDVHIRTEERPQDTASAVAGAMWGPARLRPADRVSQWGARSYEEFIRLAEDANTGVHLATGMMAARFELGDVLPPELQLLSDLRRCTADELPPGFVSGYRATVPLINMAPYLDYLVNRFRAAGGELSFGPVSSLTEATEEASVVIVCAGMGAHELVGDPGVYPIRGQIVVVGNPGLDEYFIELSAAEAFTSWMPHGERLVLGGVAGEYDWDRTPDPAITAEILRRCAEIEPRLSDVEVRDVLVGLRPGRESVRVEAEYYRGARLVHNYGHAASGISLAWGCAYEAVQLAADRR